MNRISKVREKSISRSLGFGTSENLNNALVNKRANMRMI